MDDRYTNREIDEWRNDVKGYLERIETQTTATNGRVRWLEKMIWLAIGGLSILSIIVLPLLWALINAGKI